MRLDEKLSGRLGRTLTLVLFTTVLISLSIDSAFGQEGVAAGAEAGEVASDSFLFWIIRVSGVIGLFIFLTSIYFVAVVIQSIIDLRLSVAVPADVVASCKTSIQERNLPLLAETIRNDRSFFSEVLLAGVSDLNNGIEDARDKLERTADILTARMESKISILAVLGTLGPMIGLIGTLKGMIAAFSAIAMSGVNLEASKVAEAISEALVLTFEGVLLSIPAIYFYSLFRNRIVLISHEATSVADDLLRAVAKLVSKSKPAN